MRKGIVRAALGMGIALLAVPAAADSELERMMRGESALQGKKLATALEKAEGFALGSRENPVRVAMPKGEHAYLWRLRCSDGKAPSFYRQGSVGIGPFGNILDLYSVTCAGGEPKESAIYMDMYHPGYDEVRPVPGFAFAGAPTP